MPENILLLNPPGDKLYIRDYYCSFSSKADYYWPPQDLIVLSGLLDGTFRPQVLDAIIDKVHPQDCLRRILAGDFRAVLFTTGTATLRADLSLMEKVKAARPTTTIIASAGILKFTGEKLLRENACLDACLTDFTEPSLLTYLAGQREEPLRGLIHRQGDHLLGPAASPDRQFDIPVPRHDLFSFRKYRLPIARRLPFTVVVTSLGCPYRCGFCTAGAYGYKARRVDNVIPELQTLARLGVREVLFQDPTLSISTNRVVELCRKMLEAGLNLTWSCNADIHSLNEEKISWMKKAGCHTVSIGIESGDDAILKQYSKPITTAEIRDTVRLLNKYRLRILGYFILGLPGETREMALRTIALAKTLNIHIASFAIATPDIGTRLREEAVAKGWIPADLDSWDSTDYPLIVSGDMAPQETWRMRRKAVRSFYLRPSYMLRGLRQVRSWNDLKMLASNALSLLSK